MTAETMEEVRVSYMNCTIEAEVIGFAVNLPSPDREADMAAPFQSEVKLP